MSELERKMWVYGGRSDERGKNGFTESLSSGTNNFWITNIHKSKKITPTPRQTYKHTPCQNTHHQPQNKKENSQSRSYFEKKKF